MMLPDGWQMMSTGDQAELKAFVARDGAWLQSFASLLGGNWHDALRFFKGLYRAGYSVWGIFSR